MNNGKSIKKGEFIDNLSYEKGRFVTVEQVAEIFCVSPKTVWGWIHQDKIPSLKIAGVRRCDLVVLGKWLSERNQGWPL